MESARCEPTLLPPSLTKRLSANREFLRSTGLSQNTFVESSGPQKVSIIEVSDTHASVDDIPRVTDTHASTVDEPEVSDITNWEIHRPNFHFGVA